jgi:SAM-dependent methyltransferase
MATGGFVMDCREVEQCRVCGVGLEAVLDLGTQKLGGQFPADGEQDPPSAPLKLVRCVGCGLTQLAHTVSPELMFRSYGYRSGVTETMRGHLHRLADEAWWMLPERHVDSRVLDIGGNDGTLLAHIPLMTGNKFLIDPSDVPTSFDGATRMKGFFPQDLPADWNDFNLIFTVACFYDADDPVGFAKAVADRLAPDGVWCVEVANAGRMVREGGWDCICHEHLLYFDQVTFEQVCHKANMTVIRRETNDCNGGSIRFYVKRSADAVELPYRWQAAPTTASEWADFAVGVERSRNEIADFLFKGKPGKVHLLGASTKANTWLQAVGANASVIQVASDRDRRKVGCRTPGTDIPIVSEDESRQMRPDVYLVGPWHFEREIIDREYIHLARGGRLVFPLPKLHEVRLEA